MAHFRRVLPHRVVDLRYEDLVTDPERVLREIVVGRLKLKWEASVLEYHAKGRVVQTNSMSRKYSCMYATWLTSSVSILCMQDIYVRYNHNQSNVFIYVYILEVRQSTYTSSIGSWRRYAEQLAPLRREWRRQMAVDATTARENREYLLPFGDDMNWEMKEDFDYHLDIKK